MFSLVLSIARFDLWCWWSNLMAQVYQSLRVFRGVSRFIILVRNTGMSVSLNSSIIKAWFGWISAAAASSLNLAMCLSMELPIFILSACNSSKASPTESNIKKASINSFLKFAYCLSLSFGLASGGCFSFLLRSGPNGSKLPKMSPEWAGTWPQLMCCASVL